jgi:hypothetical protein
MAMGMEEKYPALLKDDDALQEELLKILAERVQGDPSVLTAALRRI